MASNKQTNSPNKRTSHYYKKKLSSNEQDQPKLETPHKTHPRIQKIPKEPKLRAKQARQRKKFYIEKLQDKIAQLEKQLKTHKDKSAIQSFNSAFININRPDKPPQTSLEVKSILKKAETVEYTEEVIKLAGIQNAFRRLYGAVQTKNQDEAEKSIDVLRKRFGVSGQERIKWFEELMLKIVNIMMPMHCRLLLENCENRQEFYKLIGCNESMKEQRKLYFDKGTISALCQSRPAIMEIKEQYKRIVQNITELSNQMIKEANKLQKEIDKIEMSMNPLFVGKILVDLDVERKKTENLNEIFPVNFYKEQVIKMKEKKQPVEQVKSQQEEICYGSIDDDMIGEERIQGFSDEEHYLMSILSD